MVGRLPVYASRTRTGALTPIAVVVGLALVAGVASCASIDRRSHDHFFTLERARRPGRPVAALYLR